MLPKEDKTRLIQLLGMMGSDHDGEVLNAARLAQRLIRGHRLSWVEVFNGSAAPVSGGINRAAGGRGWWLEEADVKREIDAAYQAGFAAGVKHRQQHFDWRELAGEIANEDDLSDWEQQFFTSFATGVRRVPSAKQRSIFERVARRLGYELPE